MKKYNNEIKDVFVVTKPIQYINVLNIKNNNEKILILIDAFIDALIIFEKIKKNSNYWNEYFFFDNMQEAFEWLVSNKNSIGTLYIDSDINNRKQFSELRQLNITVYEEGVGSYIKKHYKPRKKLVGSLYLIYNRIRGYKNRRGGNKFTKKVIVYFPDFYKKYIHEKRKAVESFNLPFIEHISNCKEIDLFNYNLDLTVFEKKTVVLYLTSWEINVQDINFINQIECDKRIIKPHPNLKVPLDKYKFDVIFHGTIPAEILILKLVNLVKKLYIVSHFSTSTIYFYKYSNVEIVNLDINDIPYFNVKSYLDAYNSLINYIKNSY